MGGSGGLEAGNFDGGFDKVTVGVEVGPSHTTLTRELVPLVARMDLWFSSSATSTLSYRRFTTAALFLSWSENIKINSCWDSSKLLNKIIFFSKKLESL